MVSSMVSYRPIGKQFRTTCQSAIEQEKIEDVSTHESLMTDFVNTSRSQFFLLQIMTVSVIRIQMFAALCCIFYCTVY